MTSSSPSTPLTSPSSSSSSSSSSAPSSSTSTSTSTSSLYSFSSRKYNGFRSLSPKTILQMQPMAPYQRAVRIGRGDPPNFVIPPLDKSERSSPKTTNKRDKIPQLVNFFAGGFGGMMGALITCPLEVVKTRLQARYNKHFITEGNFRFGLQTAGFLGNIYKKEGILALWRGVDSHLIGVVPARAIWFGTYLSLKDGFDRHYDNDSWQVSAFCSVLAGITSVTFTCPIWVVKTRMQLQTNLVANAAKRNYRNSLDCVYRMWREEGITSFYKGLFASYFGIAESVVQLVAYDRMKSAMQQFRYKRLKEEQQISLKREAKSAAPHTMVRLGELELFILASISKILASVITYPHEVIRTRIREERGANNRYTGVVSGIARIGREEGLKGIFGGMSSHLLRVVPNAAILFVSMEMALNFYRRFEKETS